jgi:hypothetical protein
MILSNGKFSEKILRKIFRTGKFYMENFPRHITSLNSRTLGPMASILTTKPPRNTTTTEKVNAYRFMTSKLLVNIYRKGPEGIIVSLKLFNDAFSSAYVTFFVHLYYRVRLRL